MGKSPRPAAVIHPALVLRLRAGFYRRKRLPVSGFYPRKRGCLTQGSGRGLSPVPPPPPGAAAARPTARRGGRTPSGLGAGGFVPLVGEGRGSDPAALRRYRFPRGGKKKKKARGKGNGQITPKGQAGMGPRARGAKGGSVLSPVHGGKLPVGRWAMRPEEGWRRASGGNATALVLLFFKRLSIVQHVVPTRPRC